MNLSQLSAGYIYNSDLDFEAGVGITNPEDLQPQTPLDTDDECSGEADRFEGPEKTLEVSFRRKDGKSEVTFHGQRIALRKLSRRDLNLVCKKARCTIISKISNHYLDAYILSESSLFVYNYMFVLKTCGTTTLLRCLALLIELGRRLDLELDWCGYSRKNFNFPTDQQFPHGSFDQELDYLYSHRKLCQKLNGNGYTLGPVTSDHWFVFVADQTIRSQVPHLDNDRVLNIMMFDIDPEMAEIFYCNRYKGIENNNEVNKETLERISSQQTTAADIESLCPGALLDSRAFEPCGYSMNAILFQSYFTMHITPEKDSSYASFETNQKLTSYTSLMNNVVRKFRPKRFVVTLMADEGGLKEIKGNPLSASSASSKIIVPGITKEGRNKEQMVYKRINLASIQVEDDCCCMMGKWAVDKSHYHLQDTSGTDIIRMTSM